MRNLIPVLLIFAALSSGCHGPRSGYRYNPATGKYETRRGGLGKAGAVAVGVLGAAFEVAAAIGGAGAAVHSALNIPWTGRR